MYRSVYICEIGWEIPGIPFHRMETIPGAGERNTSETKAKLPQAVAGSRGKKHFSFLHPCHSLPWAYRASAEPFGRCSLWSHSPFGNFSFSLQASSTMSVGYASCEPASTPNIFSCPQRADSQKGSVSPSPALHLARTFTIQPLFPPCTTELLQKSFPPWQRAQWPRSGVVFFILENFFRWFYISSCQS